MNVSRYAINVTSVTLLLGGVVVGLMGLPLGLQVTPRVCAAPCTLRVRLQVEPTVDNRQVTVTVSGERYESRSAIPLDGEDSPKTLPYLWFKDLPAGQYLVDAVLQTSERATARVSTTVEVN